ncbi:hypothetical protein Chor_000508 [Crotalus horridus]
MLVGQHEGLAHADDSKCRCDVDPHKRCNCGPPGITPQECENKGCCFSSTVPGVPWCFKPTHPKYRKVCPTDVKLRKNCGYPGIPADKCAKRKCCFDSKPPGVPWCFFHIIVEEGKEQVCNNLLKETHAKILSGIQYSIDFHCRNCNVAARRRIDCGYPGISKETCLRKQCCFRTRPRNAKWCFFPK